MIKVYVMRYYDGDRSCWLKESMDKQTAFAMGRRFALQGRRPTVVRIDTEPGRLLNCGKARYLGFGSKRKL